MRIPYLLVYELNCLWRRMLSCRIFVTLLIFSNLLDTLYIAILCSRMYKLIITRAVKEGANSLLLWNERYWRIIILVVTRTLRTYIYLIYLGRMRTAHKNGKFIRYEKLYCIICTTFEKKVSGILKNDNNENIFAYVLLKYRSIVYTQSLFYQWHCWRAYFLLINLLVCIKIWFYSWSFILPSHMGYNMRLRALRAHT